LDTAAFFVSSIGATENMDIREVIFYDNLMPLSLLGHPPLNSGA
jgi:hypothetical protein